MAALQAPVATVIENIYTGELEVSNPLKARVFVDISPGQKVS